MVNERRPERESARGTRFEQLFSLPRALALPVFLAAMATLALFAAAGLSAPLTALALGVALVALVAAWRGLVTGSSAWGFAEVVATGCLAGLVAHYLDQIELGTGTRAAAAAATAFLASAAFVVIVAGLKRLSLAKAMLASLSVALAFVVVDFSWRHRERALERWARLTTTSPEANSGAPSPGVTRPATPAAGAAPKTEGAVNNVWVGSLATPHPTLGYVYRPFATARTVYPGNPRGYFEPERNTGELDMRAWNVDLHGGALATRFPPEERDGKLRLEFQDVGKGVDWGVQLTYAGAPIRKSTRYALSFRARADAPRPVSVSVSQGHSPWQPLGLHTRVELPKEWSVFFYIFVAPEDDSDARIRFDAGESPHALELAGVTLTPLADDEVAPMALAPESWHLWNKEGSAASAERRDDGIVRLEIARRGEKPWDIEWMAENLVLRAGQKYVLEFRARAERQRTIGVALRQGQAPWNAYGIEPAVELGPEWREVRLAATPSRDEPKGRIVFDVGADEATVELDQVRLGIAQADGHTAWASAYAATGAEVESPKFSLTYTTNSRGFRDRERTLERPARAFRIACLGDSFTFGQGVRAKDVFTARLEKLLNEHKRDRAAQFEVLNFGLCGYSTEQERLLYEQVVAAYQPQLVLLLMVENDDESFQAEKKRQSEAEARKSKSLFEVVDLARQYHDRVLGRDFTVCVAEAKRLEAACQANGARLAAVIFRCHVSPTWESLARTVRDGLAGTSVPVLDLYDAYFPRHPLEQLMVFHGVDMHPNELAHQIAADQIERFLAREKLIPVDESAIPASSPDPAATANPGQTLSTEVSGR